MPRQFPRARADAVSTDPAHQGPLLGGPKRPFDIDAMLARVETAVAPFPKAAMFALADEGIDSPFEVLVACIISIRTLDETTLKVARNLFRTARTPEQMLALTPAKIDALIHACTFHEPKSRQIHDIARRVVLEHKGHLPARFDLLTSFHGVGPKCANLTIGVTSTRPSPHHARGAAAPEDPGIGVDIHVHRVTNRWGYVAASTPERTMAALHATLPRKHWVRINALLVPFGKHICTGTRPKCSECPVREFCRQVGVTNPR